MADDGQLPQELQYDREKVAVSRSLISGMLPSKAGTTASAPEQVEKAECFDEHPDERVLEEHEHDPAQKACRCSHGQRACVSTSPYETQVDTGVHPLIFCRRAKK